MKFLRDFLKTKLLEVDPNFKEWKDGFNRDNIPSSILNKSFHIQPLSISPSRIENKIVDSIAVYKVELFYKGYLNPQESLDNGLQAGYDLVLKASHPCSWTDLIKYVSVSSITPEPLITNDNSLLINLQFSFRLISAST